MSRLSIGRFPLIRRSSIGRSLSSSSSSSSSSSIPSALTIEHREFLNLVGNHGEGKIEYNIIGKKLGEIVINNPTRRNAISGTMMLDLANIIDKLLIYDCAESNNDDKPLALILRNEGAGADLNLVKEIVNTSSRGLMMSKYMTDALNRLRQSDIISIAAINGKAIGGGAELTTTTDFRIMSESNENYISFIHAKLGAAPGWGGSGRLFSIIGRTNSLKLLGGSMKVDADTALAMKLIDGKMPAGATNDMIITQSLEILQPFLDQEFTESVRGIKRTIAQCDKLEDIDIKFEQEVFKSRWGNSDNKKALKR